MKQLFSQKIRRNDFHLILVFSSVYTVFIILSFIKSLYFWYTNKIPFSSFPYVAPILDWIIVIITMTYVAINTRILLENGAQWKKIITKHVLFVIVVNTGIQLCVEAYLYSLVNDISTISFGFLLDRLMGYIDINYLSYFVIMFIIYGYYYNEKTNKSKDRERLLENQLLNTKLKFLNSQIQPHFLFNSLNSIVYFVTTDEEKAVNMTVDLSYYLRETLSLNDSHYIPLSQELRILKRYLNLQKTRFGNQIMIQQNIQFEALNVPIPPFLLQPIIENSIKHGFNPEQEILLIKILISIKDDHLEVTIMNDGKPLNDNARIFVEGTGMSNIYNRLKTLYGNDFQININGSKAGVVTFIKLPLKSLNQLSS